MALDRSKYENLREMMKKKLSEEERFVKFHERKDDGVVSIDMFKILGHGKTILYFVHGL